MTDTEIVTLILTVAKNAYKHTVKKSHQSLPVVYSPLNQGSSLCLFLSLIGLFTFRNSRVREEETVPVGGRQGQGWWRRGGRGSCLCGGKCVCVEARGKGHASESLCSLLVDVLSVKSLYNLATMALACRCVCIDCLSQIC